MKWSTVIVLVAIFVLIIYLKTSFSGETFSPANTVDWLKEVLI